ncbi:Uncharacterized protein Rs2_38207 [Raphanus sativus]|nr:Uncharacterized protein Rs2_38207 [Raphanus sativus]
MNSDAGSSVARRRRRLSSAFHLLVSLSLCSTWFVHEFLVLLGFKISCAVASCERWCRCGILILRLLCSPPSLTTLLVPDLFSMTCNCSPIVDSCQISNLKMLQSAMLFSSPPKMTVLPSGKIDSSWFWCKYDVGSTCLKSSEHYYQEEPLAKNLLLQQFHSIKPLGPTPSMNKDKSFTSPPTGSELCSVSINPTQRLYFCSIPATPLSSLRSIKRSEHTELATDGSPGIYAFMLSLRHDDEMLFCLVSVTLWPRHGNVGRWSQCVNSTTGYSSSLVRFLSQVLNYASCCDNKPTFRICSLFSCSELPKSIGEPENLSPSMKPRRLCSELHCLNFDAITGFIPFISSKAHHHWSSPTRAATILISLFSRSLLKLVDCSPLVFFFSEKTSQTSSCRGHERSFSSFLLFIGVNHPIKPPLHKRHLSLGVNAKEYLSSLNCLLSCVMVRMGPEDTTRLIPVRLEVVKRSTSRYTVTIYKSENFEGRSFFSLGIFASGSVDKLGLSIKLTKFVSLSLSCFVLTISKRTASGFLDVVVSL